MIVSKTLSVGSPLDHGVTTPTIDNIAHACILACVDAARNLKKLKLTHCIQVTGLGLEPIRRSVVLEQLDLSQVGQHELPYTTGPMGLICEETVLPILNSIIDSNGALKHLQFPEKWIGGASGAFQTFLEKFDAFLSRRETSCLVCADIVEMV